MRKLILVAAFSVLTLPVQAAETYTVDPTHTYANFSILHLGFSTMYGRINSTGGSFTFDQDAGTGSVQINLDPATVDTGHQKRDDHLRSPDFLNVVEFPEMSYESTSVSLNQDGGIIEGNLTLMAQTKPVSLTVMRWRCGEHSFSRKQTCGFDATTTIKRSDFGMTYGLSENEDEGIGDEMTLIIEIEGSVEG